MICDYIENNTIGTTSISINPLIEKLVHFMSHHLAYFPIFLAQKQINAQQCKEKILNQELVDFLNGYARSYTPYTQCYFLFRKDDENLTNNYKPDIGVVIWNDTRKITNNQSFFCIECKRLPAPTLDRETEYVVGIKENSGGIERFKNSKHAAHLQQSAMIGYIQDDMLPDDWAQRINQWIKLMTNKESFWSTSDTLRHTNITSEEILKIYTSKNGRKGAKDIYLYHFLLSFFSENYE